MKMRYLSLLASALILGCGATPRRPISSASSPTISGGYADRVATVKTIVGDASRRHGVPADLILAVIHVESSFRPKAGSHAGARGLMQLMPRTAASLARRLKLEDFDVTDPRFNVEAGTLYLKILLRRFSSVGLALAAYNAGPARIARIKRRGAALPRYSERYIAAVLQARRHFGSNVTPAPVDDFDRRGLRALLRKQLYGTRPNVALPLAQAKPE